MPISMTPLLVLQADAAVSHCLPSLQRACQQHPAMPTMSGQPQLTGSSTQLAHRLPASVLLRSWRDFQVSEFYHGTGLPCCC